MNGNRDNRDRAIEKYIAEKERDYGKSYWNRFASWNDLYKEMSEYIEEYIKTHDAEENE